MIVTCPKCNHQGNISDKLIPEQGKYIVCPKCKERFFTIDAQEIQEGQQSTLKKSKLNAKKNEQVISKTNNTEHARMVTGETNICHFICPGCGAIIEKLANLNGNIFQCEHCKSVFVIKDDLDGLKQKSRNVLELARSSEKTGDYQQAYQYYTQLIEIDSKNPTYWMGMGRVAGYISSFHNQRIDEMIHAFRYAISAADENRRKNLGKEAGEFIFRRCRGYLASLDTLKDEAIICETSSAIDEYNSYVNKIVEGLNEASRYLPYNYDIIKTRREVACQELSPFSASDTSEDISFWKIVLWIVLRIVGLFFN